MSASCRRHRRDRAGESNGELRAYPPRRRRHTPLRTLWPRQLCFSMDALAEEEDVGERVMKLWALPKAQKPQGQRSYPWPHQPTPRSSSSTKRGEQSCVKKNTVGEDLGGGPEPSIAHPTPLNREGGPHQRISFRRAHLRAEEEEILGGQPAVA